MISTVIIGILCITIFALIIALIKQYLEFKNDMQYILDAIGQFINHCEAYKDELLNPTYFRCCLSMYKWFKEIKQTYSKYERII